jgi:alpha-L-fucosidase
LANKESLKTSFSDGALTINLPSAPLDKIATVIKMELSGKMVKNIPTESIKKMKTGELD